MLTIKVNNIIDGSGKKSYWRGANVTDLVYNRASSELFFRWDNKSTEIPVKYRLNISRCDGSPVRESVDIDAACDSTLVELNTTGVVIIHIEECSSETNCGFQPSGSSVPPQNLVVIDFSEGGSTLHSVLYRGELIIIYCYLQKSHLTMSQSKLKNGSPLQHQFHIHQCGISI